MSHRKGFLTYSDNILFIDVIRSGIIKTKKMKINSLLYAENIVSISSRVSFMVGVVVLCCVVYMEDLFLCNKYMIIYIFVIFFLGTR